MGFGIFGSAQAKRGGPDVDSGVGCGAALVEKVTDWLMTTPRRWSRWLLYGMLVLISGCASAAEYDAARRAAEIRSAQGPADCPAHRRSNGTCIKDGP